MKKLTTILVSLALLSSCAKLKIRRIQNSHGSTGIKVTDKTSGVRPSDKVNVQTDSNSQVTKLTKTGEEETTTKSTSTTFTTDDGRLFKATLEWLPDFEQEYIITWTAGMGSVTPSFTLTDGWNLTGFASTADSNFSGHLTALVSLIGAVGFDSTQPIQAGLKRSR